MHFIIKDFLSECTSVTAGAVVRPLVCALTAGVVTEVALSPHRETPHRAAGVTAAIIKEPAGKDVVHNESYNMPQPHTYIIHIHILNISYYHFAENSICQLKHLQECTQNYKRKRKEKAISLQ